MTEVMHRPAQEEVVVDPPEMWWLDATAPGSEVKRGDVNGTSDDGHKIEQENSVHFDKNEGTTIPLSFSDKNLEYVDIPKLVSAVINNQNGGHVEENNAYALINASALRPASSGQEVNADTSVVVNENIRIDIEEESEDEIIELEFDRAVENVHTHTPYCPNCKSQITKVVLRRKTRGRSGMAPPAADCDLPDKPDDLFGCLSCFSIFKLSGTSQPSDQHGHSKTLEILKCIVHGGLMESIASLGVVSSAAAAGATTLNIIAIGVASVISGLLIFGHNLMDLKNNDNSDKYQDQLGTRGHFLLHATFAILSFLVFGLAPPAVYGFTFYDSDNKDYKLLSVAAASFASVFILAIAKACVRRQQKFSDYIKTILYYMTMAISVSGVAYAVGDLIKILIDRLGWFEPSPAASSAWTSY